MTWLSVCLISFYNSATLQTETHWPGCINSTPHISGMGYKIVGVLACDHSKRSDKCNYSTFVPELIVIQYVYSQYNFKNSNILTFY